MVFFIVATATVSHACTACPRFDIGLSTRLPSTPNISFDQVRGSKRTHTHAHTFYDFSQIHIHLDVRCVRFAVTCLQLHCSRSALTGTPHRRFSAEPRRRDIRCGQRNASYIFGCALHARSTHQNYSGTVSHAYTARNEQRIAKVPLAEAYMRDANESARARASAR